MRRPETRRQGSPRGLDTRGSGGQVSTPSIRFSRSYPQTRDGAALRTLWPRCSQHRIRDGRQMKLVDPIRIGR